MASAPPSNTKKLKYEVFLSFRGKDTRDSFTSHLHAALGRKSIKTFVDEFQLPKGKEITSAILEVIEESKIAVIIFSKDYASSTFCLDEVAKIMECRKTYGQMVVPIFYHIDPSDVRKQTGSFEIPFSKYLEIYNFGRIHKWKSALSVAASLSGWDTNITRPESKLVNDVVMYILKNLNGGSPSDFEGLEGMETRIKKIKKLLCLELQEIRVVGIWGMGGIGKTTIAEALFNQIAHLFDVCCFLANVREKSEKYGGLSNLREELLSKLLGEAHARTHTPNIGYSFSVKKMLSGTRVLVVVDDLDNSEQLDLLVGNPNSFGDGSRIIVTSRDRQVLIKSVNVIYQVEELDDDEALLLFSQNAFKDGKVSLKLENNYSLSCLILEYTKGVPLALKVLGSFLFGKCKREWESTLEKLRKCPHKYIQNVLKVSYDGLDEEGKNIFLDIACFFRGAREDEVIKILDGFGFSADTGLRDLMDKSLITISNKRIEMHDLLQEMGKEIVRQESKEPGKRSRLWSYEDILRVLTKNNGTEAIEGISLDMSKIKEIELSPKAFERMSNLKFLKFYRSDIHNGSEGDSKMHLSHDLEFFPDELRYLYWHGFPLKSMPANFPFMNLIVLGLPHSRVEQLWTGREDLGKLLEIDLSYSRGLSIIPELSKASNLISMKLSGCENIKILPSSIECLRGLQLLEMNYCTSLESLPSSICKLKSLKILSLQGCSKLQIFPEILETMDNLKVLVLNGTAIEELPSSIGHLKGLCSIFLENCKYLSHLPESFCKLTALYWIFLTYCPKLEKLPKRFSNLIILEDLNAGGCNHLKFPSDLNHLSHISKLNLSGNNFEQLPASIKQLSHLQFLDISSCTRLQFISELPQSLKNIDAHDCVSLKTISGLEQLLQSKYADSYYCERFMFTNCFKLDQNAWRNILSNVKCWIREVAVRMKAWRNISSDAKLRTYEVPMTMIDEVSLNCEVPKTLIDEVQESFCIWYPGTEIPEWLTYQNEGSSISIPLDPPIRNSWLLGFALCVVISFQHNFEYHNSFFDVVSTYKVKNNCVDCFEGEELYSTRSHVFGDLKYVSKEHVVLFYDPNFSARIANELPFNEAAFEFHLLTNDGYCSESCKVKMCAVFPIYAEQEWCRSRVETSRTDLMKEGAVRMKRCREEMEAPTTGKRSAVLKG